MEKFEADPNPEELMSPEELCEKYSEEVADFFGMEKVKFKTTILKSREEIDRIKGFKTDPQVIGFTSGDNVYILDKEKWEKESPHPKSQFESALKHEVAHIYYRHYKGNSAPGWLNEGVAQLVAEQRLDPPKEKVTIKHLDENHASQMPHVVGSYMVYEIMDKYGKKKLLELVRMSDRESRYAELKRMFEWLK